MSRLSAYSAAILVCAVLVGMVFFDAWKHRSDSLDCQCEQSEACNCPPSTCECPDCPEIRRLDARIDYRAVASDVNGRLDELKRFIEAIDERECEVRIDDRRQLDELARRCMTLEARAEELQLAVYEIDQKLQAARKPPAAAPNPRPAPPTLCPPPVWRSK